VTERKKNSPVDYFSEGARRREGQLMKSFVHNRVRDRGKHRVQPIARHEERGQRPDKKNFFIN
jgi:hypothetical protein